MGKDKKHSKDKDKKRKRDKEEDEEKRRKKAAKMAKEIADHMKKKSATANGEPGVQKFVWGKKIEKDIASGASIKDFTKKAELERQRQREEEIAKVQRRREEREQEKIQQEEELQFLARERAIAEGAELDKKEELFHLEQAKARTQQRLREGRPKPIDVIVRNLYFPDDMDADAADPYEVAKSLALPELRELTEDVQDYQELDKYDQQHVHFWNAMATVATHELDEAQRQEDIDRARVRGEAPPQHLQRRDTGWHASVDADVSSMLAGKTRQELVELEASINEQLQSGAVPDPEYWTAVLSRLSIWQARARLRELHADILARQLAAAEAGVDVRAEMGWDREDREDQEAAAAASPAAEPASADAAAATEREAEPEPEEDENAASLRLARPPDDTGAAAAPDGMGAAGRAAAAAEAYSSDEEGGSPREENVGQWSPAPVDPGTIPPGADVVHEDDDTRLLELMRAQVKQKEAQRYRLAAAAAAGGGGPSNGDRAYQQMVSDPSSQHGGVHPMMRHLADAAPQAGEQSFRSGQAAPDSAAERAFRAQSERLMGDAADAGDIAFGGEVQVESQVFWWHEKHKPRKPKYFNRVHTGYEWNKYNQTHYDHDNPPPKTVQGYKFNIFFPDLIDKTEAPTYGCEKDPDSPDSSTCILRFHAGPPYEDIAFRIVNKEWEYSHKKGFKSTFERGILHLYFNFKRARYRR